MTSPAPTSVTENASAAEVDADRFARNVVGDVAKTVSYRREDLLAAVQHHVHWAHVVSGLPLERDFLFRRDVIAVAVQQLPMRSEASLGRRRAVLLRVAEALGVTERALPPLYGSEPSAPYSAAEVGELRVWATVQREGRRDHARTLLALGIGAGLATSEICAVTSADIASDGAMVNVSGSRSRTVPVDAEWWADLANSRRPDGDPVFLPGVRWYANKISDFVRVTHGDQLRPKPQRMRTTWLLRRMTEGVPLQDLLYAAGVKSLDALARFERYLPAPAAAASRDSRGHR